METWEKINQDKIIDVMDNKLQKISLQKSEHLGFYRDSSQLGEEEYL